MLQLGNMLRRAASEVAAHTPKPIPKVAEKIIWLHVTDQGGQKHVIPGFEGHSLKDTLRNNNIFIPASCKGGDLVIKEIENPLDPSRYGPSCSECQVIIQPDYYKHLKKMGEWEHMRLQRTRNNPGTEYTRLSCCLAVEKWMNGMQLLIPVQIGSIPEGASTYEVELGEERLLWHNSQ